MPGVKWVCTQVWHLPAIHEFDFETKWKKCTSRLESLTMVVILSIACSFAALPIPVQLCYSLHTPWCWFLPLRQVCKSKCLDQQDALHFNVYILQHPKGNTEIEVILPNCGIFNKHIILFSNGMNICLYFPSWQDIKEWIKLHSLRIIFTDNSES